MAKWRAECNLGQLAEAAKKSQVQGYCFAKAFYGTVQPLHAETPEGKVRAVWARFVLVTSVLLFFRFGTLLARNGMDRSLARK
jgi:hypothetical protein